MSGLVEVEVVRHPVGADGTMNFRLTFNVSLGPTSRDIGGSDLGRQFSDAMMRALHDEARRLRNDEGKLQLAYGTSREDGMPLPAVGMVDRNARQERIFAWANAAFSEAQATSLPQRGLRLLEEAIEAYQACDGDLSQAHRLVDFVFGRPKGEIGQELGGVGVCMLALAAAAGLSADDEEKREVDRVLAKPIEEFTRRNAAKNDAGFLAAGADQAPACAPDAPAGGQ